MRQKDEEKLANARPGHFEGMLGAVGHGLMRAKKDMDIRVGLHLWLSRTAL